jgi:hypothetical protein
MVPKSGNAPNNGHNEPKQWVEVEESKAKINYGTTPSPTLASLLECGIFVRQSVNVELGLHPNFEL